MRPQTNGHSHLRDNPSGYQNEITPFKKTHPYKEQSVAFVIDGGRPVAEVARNIGVHEMTLGKWVKVARDAAESGKNPDAPLGESERAELARLRAESRDDKSAIAELRMQVEFAKKVATWFAKGKQ